MGPAWQRCYLRSPLLPRRGAPPPRRHTTLPRLALNARPQRRRSVDDAQTRVAHVARAAMRTVSRTQHARFGLCITATAASFPLASPLAPALCSPKEAPAQSLSQRALGLRSIHTHTRTHARQRSGPRRIPDTPVRVAPPAISFQGLCDCSQWRGASDICLFMFGHHVANRHTITHRNTSHAAAPRQHAPRSSSPSRHHRWLLGPARRSAPCLGR